MNPERWRKIKNIVEDAVEIAPDERAAFLEKSCGSDLPLRREVEQLLEFDATREDWLECHVFDALLPEFGAAANLDGKQIGNYRIIEKIGAGGMGAVYLARHVDPSFEQKVALKIIRPALISDVVLRRFYNERQILASLKHPNIAHLIDGGTTGDNLPYFVMENVEGENVIEYAARRELSLEARLDLFRQIAAAVSFAHRNLVIHRDLKPSNILVTADGVPKLLDFGIAKILKADAGDETATHSFIFTPEYASPEQVRGEKLTTATDVYSLGVILYELLTGNRPFKTDSRSIGEIIKAVCETEPIAPSRAISDLGFGISDLKETAADNKSTNRSEAKTNPKSKIQNPKSLRGDLDNIILKALRKEPERRYSSVEQFAEDVRRHLAGLPVSASRDTWNYRASKYIRRNKIVVAAAALILIVFLGGAAATLHQANIAKIERAKAERRFNDVRRLANSLIADFPQEVDKSATKAKEMLVSRSLEYLDSLAAEAGDDINLQREMATAYRKIGDVQGNDYYSNLGDTEGALKSYEKSLQMRETIYKTNQTDAEIKSELAESFERIGDIRWTADELTTSLENYRRALAIREELAANNPDSRAFNFSLATVLWKCGDVTGNDGFSNLGDAKTALEYHRRAAQIRENLVRADPNNAEYRDALSDSYTNGANVLRINGKFAEAEESYRRALKISQEISAENPGNTDNESSLSLAFMYLGNILAENEKYDEAIENYTQALELAEKVVRQDSQNTLAQRNVTVVHRRLGKILSQKGSPPEALEHLRQALKISGELAISDPKNSVFKRDTALSYEIIGEVLLQNKKASEALASYQKASKINDELVSINPTNPRTLEGTANIAVGFGDVAFEKNETAKALEYYRKALAIRQKLASENETSTVHPRETADIYKKIAFVYRRMAAGKSPENRRMAREMFRKSYEIWNAMQQKGVLNNAEQKNLNEIGSEIARFDAASAKS